MGPTAKTSTETPVQYKSNVKTSSYYCKQKKKKKVYRRRETFRILLIKVVRLGYDGADFPSTRVPSIIWSTHIRPASCILPRYEAFPSLDGLGRLYSLQPPGSETISAVAGCYVLEDSLGYPSPRGAGEHDVALRFSKRYPCSLPFSSFCRPPPPPLRLRRRRHRRPAAVAMGPSFSSARL